MIDLIFDDVAARLYHAWRSITHPDTDVIGYYDSCDLADELTIAVVKPFRRQLIETVMGLDMEDSEAQQIQYLYTTYNNLNDPESVDALIIELYLFLIEQYQMPFHSVVRVIDGIGNMLFTTEDITYD